MAKRPKPYKTGYGRPPKDRQFKPGQSGNPRGRPRGSGRLTRVARKEAARRIPYTENGVRKQIRTDDAIVRQAFVKAATGDFKAMPLALKLLDREETGGEHERAPAEEVFGAKVDELVMADIVARIRGLESPSSPATEPAVAETVDEPEYEPF